MIEITITIKQVNKTTLEVNTELGDEGDATEMEMDSADMILLAINDLIDSENSMHAKETTKDILKGIGK